MRTVAFFSGANDLSTESGKNVTISQTEPRENRTPAASTSQYVDWQETDEKRGPTEKERDRERERGNYAKHASEIGRFLDAHSRAAAAAAAAATAPSASMAGPLYGAL